MTEAKAPILVVRQTNSSHGECCTLLEVGNVHTIVGISPILSAEGTMIPVRGDAEEAFKSKVRLQSLPKYVSADRHRAKFRVSNTNLFSNPIVDESNSSYYLVIGGGGKHGYDDEFDEFLHGIARLLEDAVFLLGDEYVGYVDSYSIKDGELTIEHLIEEGGDAREHAEVLLAENSDALFRLAWQEAQQWIRERSYQEGLEYLDKALAIQPSHETALLERGGCLNQLERFREALATLEQSIEARGDIHLATWGGERLGAVVCSEPPDKNLEVQNDIGNETATALKRTYNLISFAHYKLGEHEQSLFAALTSHRITPTFGSVDSLGLVCACLIELGRTKEASRYIEEYIKRSPTAYHVAHGYYQRACLSSSLGDLDAGLRDVKIVLGLFPDWAAEFATDPSLVALKADPQFRALMQARTAE